jgi:mannose-1-phosphate guanylyltransferase
VQAIVLVGGEGTRLRPLTLTQPKPAIRLVDRPFIRLMVDWLGRHGVDEVVMACGFRAELLRSALGDDEAGGVRIRYVEEPEPLGTAGPVRLAADHGLLAERFLALNGDCLTDLDLTELMVAHEANGATATLALYPVEDPTAYGLVRRLGGPAAPGAEPATAGGPVEEFLEKPEPQRIVTDEISAGAYVLERDVLERVPPGRAVSIEREVFPQLVGDGLYGQRLEGYWMDIGTPERYLEATWDILEGRVETDVELPDGSGPLIEEGTEVSADAEIGARAVIGAGSVVEAGARLDSSVLDSGCRIGSGASVSDSILARRVTVGEGAILDGAVVGEGARIDPGVSMPAGSKLQPGEVVPASDTAGAA